MAAEGGWFRECRPGEELLDNVCGQGCLMISYVFRVRTTRPVTEDDCKKVFTHLYRKTPTLRLCAGQREGRPWLRHMKGEKIDFKTIPNADIDKEYHDIANFPKFDLQNGPLWAGRFLPWAPSQSKFVEKTEVELGPGVTEKYPHVCHMMIVYVHIITDGFSCVRIGRSALQLLNDVISGKTIDDSEQFGVLFDASKEWAVRAELEKALQDNPEWLAERTKSFSSWPHATDLEKCFPVPPMLKPLTVCVPYNLDKETSQKFISRCKKEGLTVHTGFYSAMNAGIVSVLQKAGCMKDKYQISALHCVNERSYYTDCEKAFGMCMGLIDLSYDYPKDYVDNFWTHAKKFHQMFKSQYKNKASMDHEAVEKLSGKQVVFLQDPKGSEKPSSHMATYASSNMLDLTPIIGDTGDNVYVEYFDRLSTVFLFPIIWCGVLHSFRGQLMHSLQYNSNMIDHATAQKVSDETFNIIRKIVQQ